MSNWNETFVNYCTDGNTTMVKSYVDTNAINLNWDYSAGMRAAAKYNKVEVIKILLSNPNVVTNYEKEGNELRGSRMINDTQIIVIINPFTEAMMSYNYDVLDLFIKDGRINIFRVQYLRILSMMNEEIKIYFRNIPGFIDYVLQQDGDFMNLISQLAKDIFLF